MNGDGRGHFGDGRGQLNGDGRWHREMGGLTGVYSPPSSARIWSRKGRVASTSGARAESGICADAGVGDGPPCVAPGVRSGLEDEHASGEAA